MRTYSMTFVNSYTMANHVAYQRPGSSGDISQVRPLHEALLVIEDVPAAGLHQ